MSLGPFPSARRQRPSGVFPLFESVITHLYQTSQKQWQLIHSVAECQARDRKTGLRTTDAVGGMIWFSLNYRL